MTAQNVPASAQPKHTGTARNTLAQQPSPEYTVKTQPKQPAHPQGKTQPDTARDTQKQPKNLPTQPANILQHSNKIKK